MCSIIDRGIISTDPPKIYQVRTRHNHILRLQIIQIEHGVFNQNLKHTKFPPIKGLFLYFCNVWQIIYHGDSEVRVL